MVKRILKPLSKIVNLGIVLCTILFVFMPWVGLLQGLTEYLIHYLVLLVAYGIVNLVFDNKNGLYTGFGCAALLALYLKSASNSDLKDPTQDPEQDPVTLLHINLSLVTDASQVYQLVTADALDVVSFQEYTPDWAKVLPPFMDSIYNYNYTDVRIDPYGKALFSKSKMQNIQIFSFDDIPNPIVEIKKNNISYRIFSTYLTPPLDNNSKAKASQQLTALANAIALSNKNTIVVGEFNQVYWSPDLVKLRTKTSLLNSRKYQELTNQKLPYDQMFYTSPIECIQFTDINDENLVHIGCRGSFQINPTAILKESIYH